MPAWTARVHGKTSGTAPKQGMLSLSGHRHRWSQGLWLCKAKGRRAGDLRVFIEPHCSDTTLTHDWLLTLFQWQHMLPCQGLLLRLQGLQQRHWDMAFSTPAPQLPAGSGLILVAPILFSHFRTSAAAVSTEGDSVGSDEQQPA